MTMYYKPQNPGVMLETGFGQESLRRNIQLDHGVRIHVDVS